MISALPATSAPRRIRPFLSSAKCEVSTASAYKSMTPGSERAFFPARRFQAEPSEVGDIWALASAILRFSVRPVRHCEFRAGLRPTLKDETGFDIPGSGGLQAAVAGAPKSAWRPTLLLFVARSVVTPQSSGSPGVRPAAMSNAALLRPLGCFGSRSQ